MTLCNYLKCQHYVHNDVAFRRNADTAGTVHLSRSRSVSAEFGEEVAVLLEHFDSVVPRIRLRMRFSL